MSESSAFREPHDFYPTPPEATRALLSVESFHGPIWGPACGNGAMAKVLIAAGHSVVSTDLIDRGWGTGGINFLAETTNRAQHIITNPPYGRGLADAFIRKALTLTRPVEGDVAMLLDLAGLAHPLRTSYYLANPPATIYVMDELTFLPAGRRGMTPVKSRFCWMVWRARHVGRPSFWWLRMASFRNKSDRP
jgi:hypothetical protein